MWSQWEEEWMEPSDPTISVSKSPVLIFQVLMWGLGLNRQQVTCIIKQSLLRWSPGHPRVTVSSSPDRWVFWCIVKLLVNLRGGSAYHIDQWFSSCKSWPLWGGGVEWPFHRGHLWLFENTDVYITTHNSTKWVLWNRNKKNVMVNVTTTWVTILKGHSIRKLEATVLCPYLIISGHGNYSVILI